MALSSRSLKKSLQKAINVGIVEESTTLEEGLTITLRNLRPSELTEILKEVKELDSNVEYMTAYQILHVARALVQINDTDLRDQKYVLLDEDTTKPVKVELHRYLADQVLSTWSQQSLFVAYRKFADVLELADQRSKAGVTFLVPEETQEQKYRRLIQEAQAIESSIPDSLVESTLREFGMLRITGIDLGEPKEEPETSIAPEQPTAPKIETPPAPPPPTAPVPVIEVKDPHVEFQKALRKAEPVVATPIELPDLPPITEEPEYLEIQPKPPIDATQVILDPPPVSGVNPRFRPRR